MYDSLKQKLFEKETELKKLEETLFARNQAYEKLE
jgi:hypothetical protein